MLIRRKNWPAFLAIAILGPLFGAFLTAEFYPFECDRGGPNSERTTPKTSNDDCNDPEKRAHLRFPDGDRVELEEIAPERPVAIVVMKGPWCPVCQRQLKRLSRRQEHIAAADAAVVGLTSASPAKNRTLMRRLDLGFPILSDSPKQLLERFGLWRQGSCRAIPGVIFLDESGDVTKVHRGRYPGKPQDEFIVDTLDRLSN